MPLPQRFQHSVLSTIADARLSAFAGTDERSRMDKARNAIFSVRSKWSDADDRERREASIKYFLQKSRSTQAVPQPVVDAILDIASKHSNYADMENDHEANCQHAGSAGLQLYCSEEGYNFLFSLASSLLRSQQVTDEELVTIATLVEYLTIELYNLRLQNIDDPSYKDFTGTVFRGMSVPPHVVDDFRAIARNPSLPSRSFSIPLAMISATSDEAIMKKFACREESEDQMHWMIHVRGIEPALLHHYKSRYPDSVITSICAMPIDGISEYSDEHEVLLRGPFFHMLRMNTKMENGRHVHTCEMVMLNANRDHGTELGSNEGAKALQRSLFGQIVRATRYDMCAKLSTGWSSSESEEYRRLAEVEREAIDQLKM